MSLMTWTNEMSVGVEALDADHKKLIGLMNNLHDGMRAGKGRDVVGATLDGLIAYTAEHFAREEKLFAQTGYPAAAAHKAHHDDLVKQALAVQQKYKSGATATLSLEVLNFLKGWLVDHIQGADKKYGSHLNSKGIK